MNKKIYVLITTVVLLLSICSIIIISETPMTEKIQVTFYPYQDKEVTFNCEKGIKVKQNVNKPDTATITLPDEKAVRDLTINSKVSIDYQDENLFYGSITNRSYGDDTITFACQDKSWNLTRAIRSFNHTATGADKTASECFTEAFNNGSTFTYWTPANSRDTYNTPFIESFDASTYVIPVDTNTGKTEFFNGQNVNGLGFMKNLATVAKREGNYKYYYYYTRENDVDYLHFEPEGWRGTQDLDVSSFSLKEDIYNLYNNIIIWGKPIANSIPPCKDKWTESSIDGFYPNGAGTLVTQFLSIPVPVIGRHCLNLRYTTAGAGSSGNWELSLEYNGSNINIEKASEFHFWYYVDNQANCNYDFFLRGATKYWKKSLVGAAGAWHEMSITDFSGVGGAGQFDTAPVGGVPDDELDDIQYIQWSVAPTVGTTTRNLYLDHFYIGLDTIKSDNTDTTNGYNATSEAEYGLRETTLRFNWLKKVADCNSVAANLLAYYDSPHYQSAGTLAYFKHFLLNSKIAGTFKGIELELPIIGITYVFTSDGFTTSLTLGSQREKLEDILKMYSSQINNEEYDKGISYYLF